MVAWINRAVYQLARNGTLTHTVDPTSATGLVSGAAFTPTSGSLLVVVIEGAVTSTTPSGWTLPSGGSAINNTGLYVWYRTAASGSNSFSTTHNGSNYPVVVAVYEFAAGSGFVGSVSAINVVKSGNNPGLSGLTGTNHLFAVKAAGWSSSGGSSYTDTAWTGTPTPVEDIDVSTAYALTDGYGFSLACAESSTASSWVPNGDMNALLAGNCEALTFAISASTGGVVTTATGTVTLSGSATALTSLARTAAGTVTLSGTAPRVVGITRTAVGTLTLSGTADQVTGTTTRTASGSLALSGTATATVGMTRAATGSMTLTGVAQLDLVGLVRTAVGGLTLSGAAASLSSITRTASGTLALTGQADLADSEVIRTATGLITLGGVAALGGTAITRTALGILTLGGNAVTASRIDRAATGTLTLGGFGQYGELPDIPEVRTLRIATMRRALTGPAARKLSPEANRTLKEGRP